MLNKEKLTDTNYLVKEIQELVPGFLTVQNAIDFHLFSDERLRKILCVIMYTHMTVVKGKPKSVALDYVLETYNVSRRMFYHAKKAIDDFDFNYSPDPVEVNLINDAKELLILIDKSIKITCPIEFDELLDEIRDYAVYFIRKYDQHKSIEHIRVMLSTITSNDNRVTIYKNKRTLVNCKDLINSWIDEMQRILDDNTNRISDLTKHILSNLNVWPIDYRKK